MAAYLTLVLAAVAVVIAFMQWFVARQRFVLDLFDRCYAAYDAVLKAIRPIIGHQASDHNAMVDLQIAIQNSKFLFGSDVNDYLQETWRTVASLRYGEAIYNTIDAKANMAPDIMLQARTKLLTFLQEYPALCERYMMMPEKRGRTPLGWVKDRNDLRKSYGTEPRNPDICGTLARTPLESNDGPERLHSPKPEGNNPGD